MKTSLKKFFCFIYSLMFLGGAVFAQYFDSTAKSESQTYTERVKQDLGPGVLKKLPAASVRYLSGTMGRLDRLSVSPTVFVEHIQLAEMDRTRFYPKISENAFEEYILSFRIRSELSSRSGWRSVLRKNLEPVVGTEKDPGIAAGKIVEWLGSRVKLTGDVRTYPLTLKGDLDPLSTLKGGYGREIDAAILGVAAFRSCGIAARLVYAPVLAYEDGGKVWLEYRNKEAWVPWVPSLTLAASDPGRSFPKVQFSQHGEWLKKEFFGKMAYVVANPSHPVNITSHYTEVAKIWMAPKPLDQEPFSCSLMTWSGGRLQPLMGRDIYNLEPEDSALGLGAGEYVVVAGDLKSKGMLKPIYVGRGETGWVLVDVEKNETEFASASKKPSFFEWEPEVVVSQKSSNPW